jgi:cell division protein FtsW (lipid II flippase)
VDLKKWRISEAVPFVPDILITHPVQVVYRNGLKPEGLDLQEHPHLLQFLDGNLLLPALLPVLLLLLLLLLLQAVTVVLVLVLVVVAVVGGTQVVEAVLLLLLLLLLLLVLLVLLVVLLVRYRYRLHLVEHRKLESLVMHPYTREDWTQHLHTDNGEVNSFPVKQVWV